ncbi:MAG: transcription antitermination factor NusB [Verrucomicrobia bacterium]|nr:transcription antitermination factor NusB [Verrucomicrobiota bacterium]MBS0637056.1 transcription antitermination factor NusB [Verrucomicrobiota bacterium]
MTKITEMPPQKFRELVFLLLFSQDTHANDPEMLFDTLSHELKVSRKHLKAAWDRHEAVLRHLPDIDADISKISTSFEFHRIQKVELAILRLCCFELFIEKKLSAAIVIAEAKRLAKKFATPDAAVFCQALLDAMVK